MAKRTVKKDTLEDGEEKRLEHLAQALNSRLEWRLNKHWQIFGYRNISPPVKTIEARAANKRRLIQLTDILMGAVGYCWDEEDVKENPKPGKVALVKHICHRLGKDDLKFTSNWGIRDLTYSSLSQENSQAPLGYR